MRTPLPATEHYVLAFVGYLSIEGKISADSLPQYLSAISQYHELHHLQSRTKIPMVRSLVRSYSRRMDLTGSEPILTRIGCSAGTIREVVKLGCTTNNVTQYCCAMVVVAFVFQVRAVSMHNIRCKDMIFEEGTLEVSFYRRKGKSVRRPLILRYKNNPDWPVGNPFWCIRRWHAFQPADGRFLLSLTDSLQHFLAMIRITQPEHCHCSGHSPRIGGYKELLVLRFAKEWIMRRLD